MATKRNGRAPAIEADDNENDRVNELAEEVFQSAGSDQDNEDVEVELGDDDEEEDPAPVGTPGTRDAKRKSRWGELKESVERERAERERVERELAAERARSQTIVEMAQRQPATSSRQAPEEDPTIAEEKKITADMRAEQENYRRMVIAAGKEGLPQEDHDRFHEKWSDLDSKRVDIRARRIARQTLAEERQRQPQAPTPEAQAAINHIVTKYPDLANDDTAMQHANALLQAEIAKTYRRTRQPVKPTIDMLDRALQETRREFGTAQPPPPSAATKAKFSGMSTGQRAASGSNGKRTVTLGKAERRMAVTRWPKLPPAEAYKRMARELADDDSN